MKFKYFNLFSIAGRIAFIFLVGFFGFLFAYSGIKWGGQQVTKPFYGFLIASITAFLIVILETQLRKIPTKILFLGSIGLLWGLAISALVSLSFPKSYLENGTLRTILNLLFGYIGAVLAGSQAKYIDFSKIQLFKVPIDEEKGVKVIDTSVLIDGRIKDIVKTGFLKGHFIVPKFVIKELQSIADSHDDLARKKGRRGLDILNSLQKMGANIEIMDIDVERVKEVDLKLIEVTKKLKGELLTTDYNLNKVAKVQKVKVLNINDLANAMKPQILPGEKIRIFVQKKGKEPEQGVGYLDDGTMVVIEDGKNVIGKNVDITVTTVLQTSAGRIIFGRVNV